MKRTLARRLLALAAVAGFAGGGISAHAEGTAAGTLITNQATLDFSVSGISQPSVQSNETSFEVDRLLNVVVSTEDAQAVEAAPGQSGVTLNYVVQNLSNDTVDLLLAPVSTGLVFPFPSAPSGVETDIATVASLCFGIAGSGSCTDVGPSGNSYLIEDAPSGVTYEVQVRFVVPTSAVNGNFDAWALVAAVGSNGAPILSDDNGNNAPGQSGAVAEEDEDGVQNVFGDGLGDVAFDFVSGNVLSGAQAEFDGQASDTSSLIVAGSELTVAKASRVVLDPFGNGYTAGPDVGGAPTFSDTLIGTVVPRAVPGALVEYVITVTNGADGGADAATATDVVVTDQSPDNTTAGGDVADYDVVIVQPCSGSATVTAFDGATGTPEPVSANLGSCAEGETGTVTFYVTID
jgi:hypothetical protein